MRSNATILADQWRHRAKKWMARLIPPRRKVTLKQRTIYVLPSRHGLLFLTATPLVFIAAINYAVSLAFGLAFMMVSLFILAIFHTFNNLNHLSLTAMPTDSVYCGEQIAFNARISRGGEQGVEAALADDPAFMEESLLAAVGLGGFSWINTLRLRLEVLEYERNRRVVNYNEEQQFELFDELFGEIDDEKLISLLVFPDW